MNYFEYKYKHLNKNCRHLEAQWISVKQNIGKEIIIVNCYRQPQGSIKECLSFLEEGLNQINLDRADVFIIGDLNLNVLNGNDKDVKSSETPLKQKGLLQLIKKNTRITNTTATCIDLCYTNSNIVAKAKVWDVSLSDHELILITRKKGSTP